MVAFSLTGFLLAAVNFWAAAAASSFPAATDYPGWVALIQPEGQFAAKGQVTLGVRPLVPGGAGAQPLIEVVVTACGRGRFDGQLLLAGTTGYVQPESAPSTGLRVDTLRKASLTDVGLGTEVDLAGVRRVRFGSEILEDCVPGMQGGQGQLRSLRDSIIQRDCGNGASGLRRLGKSSRGRRSALCPPSTLCRWVSFMERGISRAPGIGRYH